MFCQQLHLASFEGQKHTKSACHVTVGSKPLPAFFTQPFCTANGAWVVTMERRRFVLRPGHWKMASEVDLRPANKHVLQYRFMTVWCLRMFETNMFNMFFCLYKHHIFEQLWTILRSCWELGAQIAQALVDVKGLNPC